MWPTFTPPQWSAFAPPLTKGCHFQASLILQAVSWYLRYPLSYRDIEELFLERGLPVDHATLNTGRPLARPGHGSGYFVHG